MRFNFREGYSMHADIAHRDVGEATRRRRAEKARAERMAWIATLSDREVAELVFSAPAKRSVA